MEIRPYNSTYEKEWLRCRVLSFLDTAYYDNVLNRKEQYSNPSIELVAVDDDQIVGMLDIEYEEKELTVCSRGEGLGGMIWHLAVHPDHQRKGIAGELLAEGETRAKELGLNRLEVWTRDDDRVQRWYEKNGFSLETSYLHVYLEGSEISRPLVTNKPGLIPMQAFAHYAGEEKEQVKKSYDRVHDCMCYVKEISVGGAETT
ncbi:GNAT family N-acetyltransferase [Alteribacter natronophilus]|uniref:GNAT family N-acetyltransferase n=1 Tax=Alteribacter natronophilus TaxID=2583810 RepID=UPI00110D7929|nr:GNAT family N-acetyltransferase [Alteribacter natronophilus]TMW71568.1 GNAT family N-acetyltransferase [Alteribacter natronophilus]